LILQNLIDIEAGSLNVALNDPGTALRDFTKSVKMANFNSFLLTVALVNFFFIFLKELHQAS